MGLKADRDQYEKFLKSYLSKENYMFYRHQWVDRRNILLYQDDNRPNIGKRWLIVNPYTGLHYYYKTEDVD